MTEVHNLVFLSDLVTFARTTLQFTTEVLVTCNWMGWLFQEHHGEGLLQLVKCTSMCTSSPEGIPSLLWEKKGLTGKDKECSSLFAKAFLHHRFCGALKITESMCWCSVEEQQGLQSLLERKFLYEEKGIIKLQIWAYCTLSWDKYPTTGEVEGIAYLKNNEGQKGNRGRTSVEGMISPWYGPFALPKWIIHLLSLCTPYMGYGHGRKACVMVCSICGPLMEKKRHQKNTNYLLNVSSCAASGPNAQAHLTG